MLGHSLLEESVVNNALSPGLDLGGGGKGGAAGASSYLKRLEMFFFLKKNKD